MRGGRLRSGTGLARANEANAARAKVVRVMMVEDEGGVDGERT
jgi:hypothetical protein